MTLREANASLQPLAEFIAEQNRLKEEAQNQPRRADGSLVPVLNYEIVVEPVAETPTAATPVDQTDQVC